MKIIIIGNAKKVINERNLIQNDLMAVEERIMKVRTELANRITDGMADTYSIEQETAFLKRLDIRKQLLSELFTATTEPSNGFTDEKNLSIQLLMLSHWAKSLFNKLSQSCTDLEREEYRFIMGFVTDILTADLHLLAAGSYAAKSL